MSRRGAGAPASGRTAIGALLAVVLGAAIALSGAPPAAAHAVLLESDPADGAVLDSAPERAELRFNEPVRLVEDAVRLFPGDGEPATLDARVVDATVVIELPADLADGAYALSYRVVSADGHPVGGALTFQIGDGDYTAPSVATAATDPATTERIVAVLTGLQYLGLLLLAGLLCFERIIRPDGTGKPAPRIRRLLRAAAGTAIGAAIILIPASAVRVTGREFVGVLPDGSLDVLAPDTWLPGLSWQPVVAAGIVLVAGLAALLLGTRARGRAGGLAAVGLAVVALATPLLVGHSQTVQPGWLMLAADLGHLLTAAYWVGGVVGLLVHLTAPVGGAAGAAAGADGGTNAAGGSSGTPPTSGSGATTATSGLGATNAMSGSSATSPTSTSGAAPADAAAAARIVARFSSGALVSAIVLAASGLTMAVLILGDWERLLGTGYGLTLLLKLAVVAAIVPLAAYNRTRLLPRILAKPTVRLQWASLRRILAYEAALLITVVAVTGFLSTTSPNLQRPPAGEVTAAGEVLRAESQGLVVDGALEPGAVGSNTLTFRLRYEGAPVTGEDVALAARLPEEGLGPFTTTPQRTADGEYEATLTLPVAGEWRLQFSVRVDTFTEPIAIVPVTIR